jgi:hypothetical protein
VSRELGKNVTDIRAKVLPYTDDLDLEALGLGSGEYRQPEPTLTRLDLLYRDRGWVTLGTRPRDPQ